MSIYLELTSAHLAHKNETLSILLTTNSCEKDLVFRNANLRKSADYTKGSAFPIRISRGSIKASFYRLTNILLMFLFCKWKKFDFHQIFLQASIIVRFIDLVDVFRSFCINQTRIYD